MDADIVNNLGLLQPYWLLLLPLPWLWLYWRQPQSASWPSIIPVLTVRYPLLGDLPQPDVHRGRTKKQYADKIMALAMSLLVLALSQPVHYKAYIEKDKASEPVDLILVVGTALSMSLSDYEVNGQVLDRMTLTRKLLDGFVADYSGHRIGLVILGNPPALWLPLTSDKSIVQDAISRIRTLLGGRITDMGATLQLVRDHFKEQQEKVVVLISDGGAQVGSISPDKAAQELAEDGFSLYVIAVGSSDPQGRSLDNNSLIYEAVNLNMLQQVARQGKGQLFHALDSQAFSDALLTIEKKHRKVRHKIDKKYLTEAWYPVPLALAMMLILSVSLRQSASMKSAAEIRPAKIKSTQIK
ncbi:MAG: VWA domain-containing protein [gamma proteobacterium symbiont of Bathyaustriella thionipta]|nr:VWA domain-containing protein [gamma proteobacterium symbiont of Bathyaustriella thionipta]MCU7949860.1 VWA domain-containing protein [gamma proteobacterium symbiont of Bathyaustriella thionipta]MCU7954940.1 VWA domain-containing protein [gamma proteobacterium symbiont of Bathyaustriella thionipta]MCU7956445.1 VWA domain-containing protein [gamma proteobacterium symbiont of Bathyaustriella thionipta]MCU7966916.1 VWA domain-containing protein [gamma proteobacterium symbiont of Bathyaustriella